MISKKKKNHRVNASVIHLERVHIYRRMEYIVWMEKCTIRDRNTLRRNGALIQSYRRFWKYNWGRRGPRTSGLDDWGSYCTWRLSVDKCSKHLPKLVSTIGNRECSAITPAHTIHIELTGINIVHSDNLISPGQEVPWEHQTQLCGVSGESELKA